MLFIFGSKSEFELIAKTNTECPLCKRKEGGLYWAAKKATIYYLPVATMQKSYVVGCPHCQEYWTIDQELGKRLHEQFQSEKRIDAKEAGREIGSVSGLNTARSESEIRDAWFEAVHKGDIQGIKKMLKRGANIDLRDGYGMTALLVAIEDGNARTVKALIEEGANIDLRDSSFGKSPLLKAIELNHSEIVQELLDHRADVNQCDKNGWSPLHRAAEHGNLELVQALLAHGADVKALTNKGITPLMQAFVKHHSEIVQLLREMGASY